MSKKRPDVALLTKVSGDTPGAIVNTRYVWEEFREGNAGDEVKPVRVKLRASITNAELKPFAELKNEDPDTKLHALLAPYVADWDVLWTDPETEETYAIGAPALAGPEAFQYIPRTLTFAIYRTIQNMPFRIVPKASPTPVTPTDEP